VYAGITQARPAYSQGIRILIDAEHLDSLLQQGRGVATIPQSCIYRSAGTGRSGQYRGQQHRYVEWSASLRHECSEG
jgi:hypothetical protein